MIKKMSFKTFTKKIPQSQKPIQNETQQSLESQSFNFFPKGHKKGKEIVYSYLNDNVNLTNYSQEKPMNSNAYTSSLTEESTAYLTQTKTKTSTQRKEKKTNSKIGLKVHSPDQTQLMPVDKILNDIQEKVIKPMRHKIHQSNDASNQINRNVSVLNTDVSTANEELSQTVLGNNKLNQTTKATSSEIERIQLENYSIQREIIEIIKDKDKMINEKFLLGKKTVLLINEFESLKKQVASMNQSLKMISKMSIEAQNQKKVLTSALLLIRKRTYELKEKVFKYPKNNSCFQKELSLILETFKVTN